MSIIQIPMPAESTCIQTQAQAQDENGIPCWLKAFGLLALGYFMGRGAK